MVVLVLVGVAVALYIVVTHRNNIVDAVDGPDDYAGSGHGSVRVTVERGQSTADIAATLLANDVVKSAEAFTSAAAAEPGEISIKPGVYVLHEQMSAESALALLASDQTRVEVQFTVPEGLTTDEVVTTIAGQTDIEAADLQAVLDEPSSLGLPPYANGKADGYLFPASYSIGPGTGAGQLLTMMVDRFEETARRLDLVAGARAQGLTAHDIVTVASLVQAESSRPQDFGKVARVIHNRLDASAPLQLDSTVHFIAGTKGDVEITKSQRKLDSPYNTYRYAGLPPGPIVAPGSAALTAAIEPTPGPWRYFVTVNPETGETEFARTLDQHNLNLAKLRVFCRSSSSC